RSRRSRLRRSRGMTAAEAVPGPWSQVPLSFVVPFVPRPYGRQVLRFHGSSHFPKESEEMNTTAKPGAARRTMTGAPVAYFLRHHFRHFNAASLVDAAEAYRSHIENGEKMMITLAGAMSTAELGLSLAEMIRQDKVHAITCTGANLEEDLFNLVAHD